MLRTKKIKKIKVVAKEDVWEEVLPSIAWEVRSTHHTTLRATPDQLVYGRDMINPIQYVE